MKAEKGTVWKVGVDDSVLFSWYIFSLLFSTSPLTYVLSCCCMTDDVMEVLFSRYGSYRLEKELQFLFGPSLRALGRHSCALCYTHSLGYALRQSYTHFCTISYLHAITCFMHSLTHQYSSNLITSCFRRGWYFIFGTLLDRVDGAKWSTRHGLECVKWSVVGIWLGQSNHARQTRRSEVFDAPNVWKGAFQSNLVTQSMIERNGQWLHWYEWRRRCYSRLILSSIACEKP